MTEASTRDTKAATRAGRRGLEILDLLRENTGSASQAEIDDALAEWKATRSDATPIDREVSRRQLLEA